MAKRIEARLNAIDSSGNLLGAGLTLAGKHYRIDHMIAEGSCGQVWHAIEGKGAPVALKVLKAAYTGDTVVRERFMREGRLLAGLSHPNLLRGLAVGFFEEQPFIVMEYLEGNTLREEIDTHAPFGPLRALALTRDLLLALDYLYSFARVSAHRDVKPGNIVVCGRKAVLIDLGIAKTPLKIEHELDTRFLGTLAYASPEQLDDAARVDMRTDIYAAGAILFEMLSGRHAFGQARQSEILKAKRSGTVVDTGAAVRGCSDRRAARDLRRLLEDSMNPDYRNRIQTTSEFLTRVNSLIAYLEKSERLVGAHRAPRKRSRRVRSSGGRFRSNEGRVRADGGGYRGSRGRFGKRVVIGITGTLACVLIAGVAFMMRENDMPFSPDTSQQTPPHGQAIELDRTPDALAR